MSPFFDSALRLRHRSVWEACDSGILIWRKSFVYLIPFFAIPFWIAACCLRFIPGGLYFIPYIALWWLKPFFDRLILHVVSTRFFSGPSSPEGNNLKTSLFGNIRRGLLGDLLWRRFSPYRASYMPLRVLERTSVKQFKQRKKTLAGGGLNFCAFISGFGLTAEVVLLVGEILFALISIQLFFPAAFSYISESQATVEVIAFITFCFNYILVESLYVCMGFGLYINSRVELEGWDLQLLFNKFAGEGKIYHTKTKELI